MSTSTTIAAEENGNYCTTQLSCPGWHLQTADTHTHTHTHTSTFKKESPVSISLTGVISPYSAKVVLFTPGETIISYYWAKYWISGKRGKIRLQSQLVLVSLHCFAPIMRFWGENYPQDAKWICSSSAISVFLSSCSCYCFILALLSISCLFLSVCFSSSALHICPVWARHSYES